MPLLRRQPFVKQKPPPDLKPEEELFHCPLTNELFRDYEQFFERIILCNSLVWTCSITGRPGLTYQEALDSEERARKQLAAFPDSLQKPVLYLSSLTSRSRLNDLNDDVFSFARERYFVGEIVDVLMGADKRQCKIHKVISPAKQNGTTNGTDTSDSDSDCVCLDDPEPPKPQAQSPKASPMKGMGPEPDAYQYVVQETRKNAHLNITVKPSKITRKKGLFTRDKCKLYLKLHCDSSGDGIWKVKARYVKKFKLPELNFHDMFCGQPPNFVKSVPKKVPKPKEKGIIDLTDEDELIKQKKRAIKEQKKASKQKTKEIKESLQEDKLTPAQIAELKSKLKAEKEALKEAKIKQLEEEKLKKKEERDKGKLLRKEEIKEKRARLQAEKRNALAQEREKKKEEKRQREEYLKSWSKPRDDMECDDLKDLPVPTPVEMKIPVESFGDAAAVVEFLNAFSFLFDVEEELGGSITLDRLVNCLMESEMSNLYFDLVKFLLTAIFNLQEEEEEEEQELQNTDANKDLKDLKVENASHKELVRQATIAAQWPQLHYGASLRQLDLDSFTVTEILRLHFLGSGADGSSNDAKFRWQQRGGYVSSDDAGLEFRRQQPELLEAMASGNLFDLAAGEKLQILNALVNQLLTYVACRDFVEDNYEKLRLARYDLKQHQWSEQRRERDETTFWNKKRIDERKKEAEAEAERKAQKKKEREERLKIDELRKDAKEKGKNIRNYLKDEGHKELLLRYDTDQKEMQKANVEEPEKEPSPRKLRSKDPKPEEPERKSNRQKEAKEKAIAFEDIPVENIEWDKVDPEERIMWRKLHEAKEKEMTKLIYELQRGHAIYPLGRDRTFRRYWVFNNLPGLFVEDDERYIPDDLLQPVEQTGASNPFNSDHLPLDSKKPVQTKDEKSTSSDKENEAISPEKNSVVASNDSTGVKSQILTEKNVTTVKSEESAMEVDDKPLAIPCVSVQEQISQRNSHRWLYFNTAEQVDKLLESLNPRGIREGPLKQALLEQKSRILNSVTQCPTDVLSVSVEEQKKAADSASRIQAVRSQSRKKMMKGVVQNSSAQELMELNLREQLLDLEERLHVGSIGILQVKDRLEWRDAIENGSYDPQSDEFPSRNPSPQKKLEVNKEEEHDDDDDSNAFVVEDLSRALVQIGKCVETKYLGPPLGEDEGTKKAKALALAFNKIKQATPAKKKKEKKEDDNDEDNSSDSEDEEPESDLTKKSALERWKDSLLLSSSLSQVFLHLAVLDACIVWAKSFLHARCRLCRRKGDADQMLLCDGCDRGHHMYCLKPPMKKVPDGDWFCPECKPKDVMKTPRKARRQSSARELEEESSDEEEKNEEESSDEDNEEDEAEDDSDDEEESDDSSSDDSDDSEEEEVDTGPAKIKLRGTRRNLNFDKKTKSAPSSGRSTPTSVRSGRGSKPGTPREGTPELSTRSGKRVSLNASQDSPPAKKNTNPRRSRETSRKSVEPGKKSVETSRRSVEKTDDKQSSEKTSGRRSGVSKRRRSSEASEDEGVDEPVNKKTTSKGRGGEEAENLHKCEELLTELMKHKDAWPFLRPVQKRDAPDYFDIVKKPMDFSTMRVKLNKFEYTDPTDILEDMRLVFANCEQYNVVSAEEYKAGQRLCRLFVGRVKELKLDKVLARKNSPAPKSKRK